MQKENEVSPIQGLFIDRHPKFGEMPNHQEYTDTFTDSNEYAFDMYFNMKYSVPF